MTKETKVAYGFMQSHLIQALPLNTFDLDICSEFDFVLCSYANFLFLETTELVM